VLVMARRKSGARLPPQPSAFMKFAAGSTWIRTSAASDLMRVETCIMSIRMLSIPAADMLKVACFVHRPSSYML